MPNFGKFVHSRLNALTGRRRNCGFGMNTKRAQEFLLYENLYVTIIGGGIIFSAISASYILMIEVRIVDKIFSRLTTI